MSNVTELTDEKYLEGYINRISNLNNTSNKNFFYIGFNLLELHTLTQYHLKCGYDDIYQFADKNFRIGKSSVHYMMQIVKKFAEEDPKGGFKKQLKKEYQEYKYSQLRLLCGVDIELHEHFMPSMTISDMEGMKKFLKEEKQEEEKELDIDPPDEEPAARTIDIFAIKIPLESCKKDYEALSNFIKMMIEEEDVFKRKFTTGWIDKLKKIEEELEQIENLLQSEGK